MKWIKAKFPGVRYREHETRKHGIQKDKYFAIRWKVDGKDREEGLGWASTGWTEAKANETLAEIKKNIRDGQGHQSLAEKREINTEKKKQIKRDALTVSDAWEGYSKIASIKKSYSREEIFFRLWIKPTIGNRAL